MYKIVEPCPFCHSRNTNFENDGDLPSGYVFCGNCGAKGPLTPFMANYKERIMEAVRLWENRHAKNDG